MKLTINLLPVSKDEETLISVTDSVITINGVDYDLSDLPDGATAKHYELVRVTRNGDEYECTVRLGHGPNAPYETRFPDPIVIIDHRGPVELPVYDLAPEQEEAVE